MAHQPMLPPRSSSTRYDACAADVYALGVVFFVALTCQYPFAAENPAQLYARIVNGQVNWPADLPQPVMALLTSMMDRNPAARPTAAAILALPWLAGLVAEMGIALPGAPMSALGPVMPAAEVIDEPIAGNEELDEGIDEGIDEGNEELDEGNDPSVN
jgi:serine/threonine protein kinase